MSDPPAHSRPPKHPSADAGAPYTQPDDPTRVSGDADPGAGRRSNPAGPTIEGYQLEEEIHRGGQGVVYRGVQLGTKRTVAVKVLLEGPFAGESTRRRFEREIELAAGLRHPNIVTILESGVSLGRYYFAMEYIAGERLDRYLARRRPSLDQTLALLAKICDVVNHAHQRGVIHRDLKPANILVDAAGEPHMLDFGLAKHMTQMDPQQSTVQMLSTSGQILGTVAYMSPEQAAGSLDVDVRSDVYSLGVIFYEALVGQPPYTVSGPLGEILQRIAHDDAANPRSMALRIAPDQRLDDELATILLKALEKEPERRYQTAGEFARDLRHRLAGAPIEAKRASGIYMLRKLLSRYRLQAATAGVIVMMLVGFLITFAVLFTRERDARQEADARTREARAAVVQREAALGEARARTAEAVDARDKLQGALIRQHIQRGDLALAREDPIEACRNYWEALEFAPTPAAVWALRHYYLHWPNMGTILLGQDPASPTALSPDGALVAYGTRAGAIAVQEARGQRLIAWVLAPGPIEHVQVDDTGMLVAGGPQWMRVWKAGVLRPTLAAAPLSELFNLERQAMYAVDDGRALVVIGRTRAALFCGERGELVQVLFLGGGLTGQTDALPGAGLVGVPTTEGAELLRVDGNQLHSVQAWSAPDEEVATAVRFDGTDRLAVLCRARSALEPTATRVYAATLTDGTPTDWQVLYESGQRFEGFDLEREHNLLALATSAGRITVLEGERRIAEWDARGVPLQDIRIAQTDASVAAVDDKGTVTFWLSKPPIAQRRIILRESPESWKTARDGSAALMALPSGRVVAYAPTRQDTPLTLLKQPLLALAAPDIDLAIDADGTTAVIRDGTTVRFTDMATQERTSRRWQDASYPLPGPLALSDDGGLLALLAETRLGDGQRIAFWTPNDPNTAPPPFDFVGADVRALAFVPGSHEVVAGRSNGELFRLDPGMAERQTTSSWVTVDAPITHIAFDQRGAYLAVACENNTVQIVDVNEGVVRRQVRLAVEVTALAFNPRDALLLARTADGGVQLLNPATGERVSAWSLPADTTRPMAAWLGAGDALLLEYDGAIREHRYQFADQLIEQNRPLARQQRIATHLAQGDFAAAWHVADECAAHDAGRGRALRTTVLVAALLDAQGEIPDKWIATVADDAPPWVHARLGHAAYRGERFDLAAHWLDVALEQTDREVDAFTLWEHAAAIYLANRFGPAADELAEVLTANDFDVSQAPLAAVQRVAALVLAGRMDEARAAALAVGDPDTYGGRGDFIALTAASVIARYLTGIESEQLMFSAIEGLVTTFAQRALLFRDDIHFFLGEIERTAGRHAQAAVQYQRCIDLSRDAWPANWSRHRLLHLGREAVASSNRESE